MMTERMTGRKRDVLDEYLYRLTGELRDHGFHDQVVLLVLDDLEPCVSEIETSSGRRFLGAEISGGCRVDDDNISEWLVEDGLMIKADAGGVFEAHRTESVVDRKDKVLGPWMK
jgi:hypothetical protein